MAKLYDTHLQIRGDIFALALALKTDVVPDRDDLGALEYVRTSQAGNEIEMFRHTDGPNPEAISILAAAPKDTPSIASLLRRLGVAPNDVYTTVDRNLNRLGDLDTVRHLLDAKVPAAARDAGFAEAVTAEPVKKAVR